MSFTSIENPALHDRFDAACAGTRVLLVCAAAGTGKTTAVTDWLRRRAGARAAGGLTVTAEVDHPERFFDALADCLGLSPETVVPQDVLHGPTGVAGQVVAALARLPGPMTLIVDDAHLLTDPLVLAGFEYLLQHAPPGFAVVVCARFEPPVRWHGLPLAARLTRIGADELAFSPAQVRELCGQHGCHLDDRAAAELARLTGGWPALVRIAALHFVAHPGEPGVALAAFAHPAPAVSDFLRTELIGPLPPPLRQFLLYTAIPESFTPALAEALAGPGARHLLRELERVNFPLSRQLDEGESQLTHHPLVHAHLRDEIRYATPGLARELALRTAAFHDRAGRPLAALPHLLTEPSVEPIADFLRRRGIVLVLDGAGPALFDAITELRPALNDDPFVWLLRAVDALAHGDRAGAVTCLELAHNGSGTTTSVAPAAWLAPLRQAVAVDTALVRETADQPDPPQVEAVGHAGVDGYLATQLATAQVLYGNRIEGSRQLRRGLLLATGANQPRLALRSLTRLAATAGLDDAVTQMRERAGRALVLAADHTLAPSSDTAHALALSLYGAFLQGDSWDAAQAATLSVTREQPDGSTIPVAGWSADVVGRLLGFHTGTDRHDAAAGLRHSMMALLEQGGPLPVAAEGLLPHVVRVLLEVREPRTAQLLIEHAGAVIGATPRIELCRATSALAENGRAAAQQLFAPVLEQSEALPPIDRATLWLLYAVRSDTGDRRHRVRRGLDNALAAATPQQLMRPFLEVPGSIALLDDHAGSFGDHEAFVERVRHHTQARRPAVENLLTAAEMTVLRHLPSGRTAEQIATALGVSVNTVKTHMRGVYAKFGVHSRPAALERARRDGIL